MSDFLWSRGLYSPWDSPGQNTGVGSLSLLQGIFPTQRSNPGLPYCWRILYQLSHQGEPWSALGKTPKTITPVTSPGPQGAQGGKAQGASGCSRHTGSPTSGGLTWSRKLKSSVFSFSVENLLQKHLKVWCILNFRCFSKLSVWKLNLFSRDKIQLVIRK